MAKITLNATVFMELKKEVPEKSVMEVESGESSTEEAEPESESPRSVVMEMKKKVERVHSQILRIREEESHLGEDFVGGDKKNKNDVVCGGGGEDFHEKRRRRVNVLVVSRPVLPCSPLSGKNNVRRPCTETT
ncbi:hypothetical protein QUC31_017725 [Theobroma cacao]|uniref:Uncharacterized protein isoform 1 n=2 Tax=Theobroma cacao TaxID=3641 RepID=A0A061EM83_THECC|nr:Uncharacterized protein TCM_018487 isoform 1 [Theobroma cacao]